jgi:hypothetical protein
MIPPPIPQMAPIIEAIKQMRKKLPAISIEIPPK